MKFLIDRMYLVVMLWPKAMKPKMYSWCHFQIGRLVVRSDPKLLFWRVRWLFITKLLRTVPGINSAYTHHSDFAEDRNRRIKEFDLWVYDALMERPGMELRTYRDEEKKHLKSLFVDHGDSSP